MSLTPLGLGTQGRYDFGADYPLSLGTQGRFRTDGIVPFDPVTGGGGGSPLPGEDTARQRLRKIQLDDERVLMAVIKKFLEMRRDG